ncbi:hypothetical protein PEX2_042010 [Penicillium expansum]|uniref:Uncharacterized protein n=1 Tax=Penicillium expansum TaxID=27334 RepID=A0A0A2K5Q6_PENEN|nr:hypothetical protein PEX2_042010 [Penicillium expansum]KGO63187.1 hypothetical protein PEX2_042010 [Penicillium expansum]
MQSRIGIRRMRVAPDLEMGTPKKAKGKSRLGMPLSKKQSQSIGDSNRAVGLTGGTRVVYLWTDLTISLRETLQKRACIASATDGPRASSQVAGHYASAEDPSRCDGASERRIKGPFRPKGPEGHTKQGIGRMTHELGGTQIRGAENCLGSSLVGGLTGYRENRQIGFRF